MPSRLPAVLALPLLLSCGEATSPSSKAPIAADQFALIQPGTFQMGSDSGTADQKPAHAVTISHAFYIQKTEVTQAEWRAVMGTNPSIFSTCGDACPVDNVSWDDVQTFLATLNASSSGVTYRLPTEAEWEYAARAGTVGDEYGAIGAIAWYTSNAETRTHPTAELAANPWGLYDMIGNVWEWVSDWYSPTAYTDNARTDPSGPASGSFKVLRGGAWNSSNTNANSVARYFTNSSMRAFTVGFRLARSQ